MVSKFFKGVFFKCPILVFSNPSPCLPFLKEEDFLCCSSMAVIVGAIPCGRPGQAQGTAPTI